MWLMVVLYSILVMATPYHTLSFPKENLLMQAVTAAATGVHTRERSQFDFCMHDINIKLQALCLHWASKDILE